jgi:hypothetical protein
VEGAISLLLQGEASPDTRRILENGVNPMLASAPKDTSDALADSLAVLAEVDNSMSSPPSEGKGAGAKNTGIPARAPNPLAQPVQLTGFAQIAGLALGAPEFQRH